MDALKEKAVRKKKATIAKARQELLDERDRNDINALMEWPEGRRLIRRILGPEGADYYHSVFHENSNKQYHTDGKRKVGANLIAMLVGANKHNFIKLTTREQEDR